MAYIHPLWYEEMPTPWDIDCRGKFPLHKSTYNLDHYDYGTPAEQKYNFYKRMRTELEESGKFEWLEENEIDKSTLKITTVYDAHLSQLRVIVLINLPQELKTLYTLRFAE